jgi:hypothetical protein
VPEAAGLDYSVLAGLAGRFWEEEAAMNIRAFRAAEKISQAELAGRIRKDYGKFDVKLVCKIERPEDYGIRLLPGAERAAGLPRRDCHTRGRVAKCRLTETDWQRLQMYLTQRDTTL